MIPTNGLEPPFRDNKGYKEYIKKLEKEKEEQRERGVIPAGDIEFDIPGETPEEAKERQKYKPIIDPRRY